MACAETEVAVVVEADHVDEAEEGEVRNLTKGTSLSTSTKCSNNGNSMNEIYARRECGRARRLALGKGRLKLILLLSLQTIVKEV